MAIAKFVPLWNFAEVHGGGGGVFQGWAPLMMHLGSCEW